MDEMQFIGYAISAVITIGAFLAVVMKFVKPINELRIVIQKLIDNIDNIQNGYASQENKLNKHDAQIDDLGTRVCTLETKMDLYHNSDHK